MRVSELAKQYLRECLPDDNFDEPAFRKIVSKSCRGMNQDELNQHRGALHMMHGALLAVKGNDPETFFEDVSAEIDRREALIIAGWEKNGAHYVKIFESPPDALRAIEMMKECGISSQHSEPGNKTKLLLKVKSHQWLMMMMEGRASEIE